MSVSLKKQKLQFLYDKLKCRWSEQVDAMWAAADKQYAALCAENRKGPLSMLRHSKRN